jgi:3-oxoacid CoA-transferase subunit A
VLSQSRYHGGTAALTVAEVEHLVKTGEMDTDQIHTPGIFVKRIILATHNEKRIERRIVRTETV